MAKSIEYNAKLHPQMIKYMCRSGLTNKEIAEELGMSVRTFDRWKVRYPEVKKACEEGKEFIDSLVEDSLLRNALGYDYEETETISKLNTDGTVDKSSVRVKKVKKHRTADTRAAIQWLNNRQPEKWREKKEIAHSGNINNPFENLTEEELRLLIGEENE